MLAAAAAGAIAAGDLSAKEKENIDKLAEWWVHARVRVRARTEARRGFANSFVPNNARTPPPYFSNRAASELCAFLTQRLVCAPCIVHHCGVIA